VKTALDLLSKGKLTGSIELTLSLHSSESLQAKYGSHLKLFRPLHQNLPLLKSGFVVCSADPVAISEKRAPSEPEAIKTSELRLLLKELNVTSEFQRLMFCNSENVQYFVQDTNKA
jgi:hypothetical protein